MSQMANEDAQDVANHGRQSVSAGVVLIVAGGLSIIAEIIAIVYSRTDEGFTRSYRPGVGIWSGVLCVVAGCFDTMASISDKRCRITALVVFSLTASIVCLLYQFDENILDALVQFKSKYIGVICPRDFPEYRIFRSTCVKANVLFAADLTLTLTAFVGGIAGIRGAVVGCKRLCCKAVVNGYRGAVDRYNRCESRLSGSILILTGLLSITFNSVVIGLRSSFPADIDHIGSVHFELIGHGIWSGFLCILAGFVGFGKGTGLRKTRCTGTASATISLAATVACFLYQLHYGMHGALWAKDYDCQSSDLTKIVPIQLRTLCIKNRAILTMQALLALLAIVGGAAGIWRTVICCRMVCSDASTYARQQPLTSMTGVDVQMQSNQEHPELPEAVSETQLLQPDGATVSAGVVPSPPCISVYQRNIDIVQSTCNTTRNECGRSTNYADVELPPPYDIACQQ